MTIEQLIIYGKENIHSTHAKILLAELLNYNPLELLNHLNEVVSQEQEEIYKQEIEAIKTGKPLQYVMGYVNFYGNRFNINENVLIPRFETEELVENTINYIKKFFTKPVEIIDLGCGSGAIGLTLKKKIEDSTVDLIDISEKALEIAQNNSQNLGIKANIYKSDMFSNVNKKYDVIISNPPYIKTTEEIEKIVKDNEPHLALYAGEDGLDCYKKILKDIKQHMKDKCIVAFEIGNTQANDITKLIKEYLENIKIIVKKDLSEKDRMIFILKNCE